MKKIDLTVPLNKVNFKTQIPYEKDVLLSKLKKTSLKKSVVDAIMGYTHGSIDEANEMFQLAQLLSDQPVITITDEQFELVEKALVDSTVAVKSTWNTMVNQLNA